MRVRHTLQITSAGGAGTTMLYRFAEAASLDIYSPSDGGGYSSDYGLWKHRRHPITRADYPKIKTRIDYRVVYLVSNPYNAVYSLFRRGFHLWALERLEVPKHQACKLDRNWTLHDYLDHGEDLFGMEDHVRNWTERPIDKNYPILVLKYERIEWNKDVLLNFMRVPEDRKHLFPKLGERESNFRALSTRHQNSMHKIYGRLAEYIDSLPEYFVR